MVLVIPSPLLLALCIALALPYLALGVRALTQRAARTIPERHGLRDLE